MWTRHARSRVIEVGTSGRTRRWVAEHDGYATGRSPAWHRRTVELDAGGLRVLDEVDTPRSRGGRLSYHLGPDVTVDLAGTEARLSWRDGDRERSAALSLPAALSWSLRRGEHDPPAGWYSAGFGLKQPASTLVGVGPIGPGTGPLNTVLTFDRGPMGEEG